ncbi:MAG TPA: phage tail tape measure protein [Sphingomicrobium sp.]|jgi:hypothetical protein
MPTTLRDLAVNLTMNVADFTRNASVAERRADAMKAKFDGIGSKITSGIKGSVVGFATGLAGAFTIDAIVGLAKSGLEYASSLGEVAQQLGVTSTELQEYRYAATQVGIAQDEMDQGLAKLTRSLGVASSGTGAQAKVFAELGISVRDANGHVKTAGAVMPELANALAKIPDPAKRAAIEVTLFGKSGQKLDTLLSGGASQINNLRDAAQKLGVVLSEKQIQKADETADKLAALKTVLQAQIAGVVADNADAIMKLADSFADLATEAVKAMPKVKAFFERMQYYRDWLAKKPLDIRSAVGAASAQEEAERRRLGKAMEGYEKSHGGSPVRVDPRGGGGSWLTANDNAVLSGWNETLRAIRATASGIGELSAKAEAGAKTVPTLRDEIIKLAMPTEDAGEKARRTAEEFQQLTEELNPDTVRAEQYVHQLDVLRQGLEAINAPAEKLNEQIGKLTLARYPEVIEAIAASFGAMNGQTGAAIEANDNLAASAESTRGRVGFAFQGIAEQAAGAFGDLVANADSLKGFWHGLVDLIDDSARSIIASLVEMSVKFLLFKAISGIFGGGSMSPGGPTSIGGGLGDWFAAHPFPIPHAQGGPVVPGRTYLVGEQGPEYVRFGSRGYVTPNRNMGRGGGITVNQHFAPNFAGNAATHEDLARMGMLAKHGAIQAIREERRRA